MRTLALLAALLAGSAAAEPLTITARAFDGTRWHDALRVTIDGDRLASVQDASASEAQPGLVLTPGLVDLDARWGLRDSAEELHEAIAPDLRLADGFEPDRAELDAFRRSGVTTAWLLGGDAVVVAGAGAVLQPSASGPARLLRPAWGLSGSLATTARLPERAPTSLPDQARALGDVVGSVEGPARVRYDDAPSFRHAARLGLAVGLPPSAADLADAPGARLVASADWTSVRSDRLALLRRAREGGATVAFGSGSTAMGSSALRLAAARLAEEGEDPRVLLQALTRDAADLIGEPQRGRLATGAPADVVLWTGDPVSLRSRVLRAWVSGEEVFRAP